MSAPNLTSVGYRVKNHEDLRKNVPAAFATSNDPSRSNRYSFLPTEKLLDSFESAGWEINYAKQSGSSVFSRHLIRLSNPKLGWMDFDGDKVKPQALIDNSHDGKSSAKLYMGLFRLICTNGIVVSKPGLSSSVKFRHVGVDTKEIIELMDKVAQDYNLVQNRIREWQDVPMNEDQKTEFVIRAMAMREPQLFIKDDGTIDSKLIIRTNNPNDLVMPIRGEDKPNNLWSVFNIVQERMVKGGYFRKSVKTGRRSVTRGMTNATRHTKYNMKLWELAEEYAEAV